MSGREIVDEMRASGEIGSVQSGRSAFDLILIAVAVLAIGSAGYFGINFWLSHGSPQPVSSGSALPAVHNTTAVAWTAEDSTRCTAKARAAGDARVPDEMALANRAVTEGFARFATNLDCYLTTKAERFCDPKQKATLVAAINDYLGRVDLVQLGLGLQGAPMALMGGLFGGEIAGGSAMYDEEHKETLAFMATFHKRIAADLQRFTRDSIVAPGDFGGLLGGVPKPITAMIGAAVPTRNVCG